MIAKAWAPASATAVATGRMSVTFGVSLTIRGKELRSLTACVTAPAIAGSVPKSSPWATLGQDMLSSKAAIPGRAVQHFGNGYKFFQRSPGHVGNNRHIPPGPNWCFVSD